MQTTTSDLCVCGHWTRHHKVGKHNGCGHCTCKGFVDSARPDRREGALPGKQREREK